MLLYSGSSISTASSCLSVEQICSKTWFLLWWHVYRFYHSPPLASDTVWPLLSMLLIHVSGPFQSSHQSLFLNKFTLAQMPDYGFSQHSWMNVYFSRRKHFRLKEWTSNCGICEPLTLKKRDWDYKRPRRKACWLVVGWNWSSCLPLPHHSPFLLPRYLAIRLDLGSASWSSFFLSGSTPCGVWESGQFLKVLAFQVPSKSPVWAWVPTS